MVDLDAIDSILATTRSVRRRLDFERPVPRDVILDCINIAVQAPTGRDTESWRFVVVTDERRKAALADLYRDTVEALARDHGVELKATQKALAARLGTIPAMVFVCAASPAPPPGTGFGGQVAWFGSLLPAAWSLMLAFRARGIGATWTTLLSAREAEVADLLGMPVDESSQLVMLPIAYTQGATLRRAERLDAREVTFWDQWGQQ